MTVDALSLTFGALADPTRRAILQRLASGPVAVKDLAKPFDISGPAVSKHLRVLERAGLISRSREAQTRPCRLEPAPIEQVVVWAESYRAFWDAKFDRLESYVKELHAKQQNQKQNPTQKDKRRGK